MKKYFLLLISGILIGSIYSQKVEDPILLTISGKPIKKSEFLSVYQKNNNKSNNVKQESISEYLEMFINFRLKVKEAEELGYDTTKSFLTELDGYRKQLTQPYLVDKSVNDKLINEAYERLQKRIRASHLLIKCESEALPKDTIEAYDRILIIRDAINGKDVVNLLKQYENVVKIAMLPSSKPTHEDSLKVKERINSLKELVSELSKYKPEERFAKAAYHISDDLSAHDAKATKNSQFRKGNSGDLGYFTAFSMVYPFENAAYNTKENEISMPFRSKYGYHLVKVTDIKSNPGQVQVAHIMIRTDFSDSSIIKGKQKITEIYNKVKAGENFEDLAKKYSDDKSSAVKGGVMGSFTTGRMVPEFENASFNLKNNGDVCEPIKSDFGWHIIKRLDLKSLQSFDEMKSDLKAKIGRDTRAELPRKVLIAKIKKENNFIEFRKNLKPIYTLLDTSFFNSRWNASKADGLKEVVCKICNKNYTQKDFANYLALHQTNRAPAPYEVVVNKQFDNYINELAIACEDSRLEEKYPEFKNLMNEYRDGILLFELTDNKVWSKAVKDSVGIANYYEKNKSKYIWEQRVDATIYNCSSEDIAKKVREMIANKKSESDILSEINKDSQLNLKIENNKFTKGENKSIDQIQCKEGLSSNINVDKSIVFVDIHKILQSEPKTLAEAKGLVTVDYQNILEKEWIDLLRRKYPVVVNQEVFSTIK